MTDPATIKCPHPDRKEKGDEMFVTYCKGKCKHYPCEAWKK